MGLQTFHFLLRSSPDWYLISFIFFATICSYSFHWFLTSHSVIPSPRINWTIQHKNIHLFLFFIGLTGAGVIFFQLIQYWHWLLLASIITFLYSAPKIPHPIFRALRKVALGKTIFLAVVWMYVTTVLPIVVSNYPWQPHYLFFILSRFFLIYAICILFDLRDREDDKANGIRSLITFLSPRNIFIAFAITLLFFIGATLWLIQYNYELLPIILLIIPGIIVAGLYNYAKTNFSDMLYYFILDGLMAFSSFFWL
jgi:4-hydroxybenzoate polyprenyltransferase